MILISVIIGGIALFLASLTDLKTREVPDLLNYAMVCLGLGIAAIYSILFASWQPILQSVVGLGIGFIIGESMFYAGQWGGGDTKALEGIGALVGASVWNTQNFYFITFLVNIIIVGAFYGIAWSIALAIKHRKVFLAKLEETATAKPILAYRRFMMGFAVLGVACSFLAPIEIRLWIIGAVAFLYLLFYLWLAIRIIERNILTRPVAPETLTEGDWIATDIYVRGKYIAGPKDLGVSNEQIRLLITLKKQKKIKTVVMKSGIPLVPSWLLAYLLTFIVGNWLLAVI